MNNTNMPDPVKELLNEFRGIIEGAELSLAVSLEDWKRRKNRTATGYMVGCEALASRIDRWRSLTDAVEKLYLE
jgi:hypothetical protein